MLFVVLNSGILFRIEEEKNHMYIAFILGIYLSEVQNSRQKYGSHQGKGMFQADCTVYRSPLVPETKQRISNKLEDVHYLVSLAGEGCCC